MFKADLKTIQKGDIVPITMYGSVHNIGFVYQVSGGMIKINTLIGQDKLVFSQDYGSTPQTPEEEKRSKLSPERLNGSSARNVSIGALIELPDRLVEKLKTINESMSDNSSLKNKIILEKNDDTIKEVLNIFRTSVLENQLEMPGVRL